MKHNLILKNYKEAITPPYGKKDLLHMFFIIAILGSLLLSVALVNRNTNIYSNAQSINTVEPENGTVSGTVTVVDDATASGGKYVRLGIPNPSPTARPTPSIQLKPISYWEGRYKDDWNYNYNHDLPLSQSPDSWDYYNLAYGIDDSVAMYRATNNTKYLDNALVYVNNMIGKAKVSSSLGSRAFKDSYMGWISNKNGSTGEEVPLYESYCWRYVSTMLRVMKENPAVYNNPTYRSQYDKILAFTEVNMFDKWHARGVNDNIYRSRTHMASHWAMIAMNVSILTADPTRKAKADKVVEDINYHLPNYNNASLHGQMVTSPVNPAGYFWSDVWGSTARPGQDVAHGNAVIAYVVEAHDLGLAGWTDTDIQKFIVTLDKVIWKTSSSYGDYVDGSGKGDGWFLDGFVKLGRYNATIQKRNETHPVGFAHGNNALNAKLLGVPY